MFLKRKVGVTERPRSLNPIKATAMAICPVTVHFSTWRARSMHGVAWRGMAWHGVAWRSMAWHVDLRAQ